MIFVRNRARSSFLISLFIILSAARVYAADILIFAASVGDETLGCGLTIAEAVKAKAKIKVVFLANSDDNPDQSPKENLDRGSLSQSEAILAIKALGLTEAEAVFLSYPANGLKRIWEEDYNWSSDGSTRDYDIFRSPTTRSSRSLYKMTYGKARLGYNRSNLISDIKEIIKKDKPKMIYLPSAWDSRQDRVVCASLINKVLNDLVFRERLVWPQRIRLSYYTLEPRIKGVEYGAFLETSAESKESKQKALREYGISLRPDDKELFWHPGQDAQKYLDQVFQQWREAAQAMKGQGYDANMGVVADVAADIDDTDIDLVKKGRIFSDDPDIVSRLVEKIVLASDSAGIIPVVKHFPGLGSAEFNTHQRLATIYSARDRIWEQDFLPYRRLVKTAIPFWVMTDHAVYPALDSNPASLSYEIQTRILRGKLGFQGLIISDDLMQMGAMEEYALRNGLEKPYIGEIAVMAFAAGTDIAIIYPEEGRYEEVISRVITSVKQAVRDGRLSLGLINSSVKRILREKERIFGVSLTELAENMTLEEKICQKILVDIDSDVRILDKYYPGAVFPRDHSAIEFIRKACRIPPFIVCQHEGGRVAEINLGLNSPGPYLVGREYERILGTKNKIPEARKKKNSDILMAGYPGNPFNYGQVDAQKHREIADILCADVDEDIKAYVQRQAKGDKQSIRESAAALTLPRENLWEIGIKKYQDLSMGWLSRFPDNNTASYAYNIFKKAFEDWRESFELSRKRLDSGEFASYDEMMISGLTGLRSGISRVKINRETRPVRVLCLAAHPDDEDAEALAYFKNKYQAETYILFATRGESGNNHIGPQINEELGALRSEEAAASAALLGVKTVYYLDKKDFGYCEDPKEALAKWGRNETLSRLVYFYRLIKPDIIITKLDPDQGHCQHRVLISLARSAFHSSADRKTFPLKPGSGLSAWQPARFYQREKQEKSGFVWNDLVIDAREKIPLFGKTYNDLARETLARHKSQNIPWFPSGKIGYKLVDF